MKNFFVAWDNQADTAVLSTGSWGGTLDRLKDYRVQYLAKTTDAAEASTKFRFATASPVFIALLGLFNTNASVNAKHQWLLYTDATFTTVKYDTGVLDLYPMGTIPFGTIPWGAPNWWTGKPLPAEIALFQRNIWHELSVWQYGQYGEFRLFDSANSAGFFTAGRFGCMQAFRPRHNAQYGAQLVAESRTDKAESEDGTPYSNVERARFSMPIAFPRLDFNEGMKALQLKVQADVHGECFCAWDTSDVAYHFQRSVFGRLAKLDGLAHPLFKVYESAFQVEGVL